MVWSLCCFKCHTKVTCKLEKFKSEDPSEEMQHHTTQTLYRKFSQKWLDPYVVSNFTHKGLANLKNSNRKIRQLTQFDQ